MFKIENNLIYLTRGDTAYLTVELEDDEKFNVGDIANLSIKKNLKNETAYSLHKEIVVSEEKNSLVIKIDPDDTKNMDYGLYYYDIQLKRASNGDIFTIVTPDEDNPKPNFKLLKEVTSNE